MTIDEAIERYTRNAEYERTHGNLQGYLDFRQLAEWLTELKKLREQTRWIPVSERLPEDGEIVLITSSDMYLSKLKPWCGWKNRNNWYTFTANGSYLIKYPIAWMPLPEPFEPQESEDKE